MASSSFRPRTAGRSRPRRASCPAATARRSGSSGDGASVSNLRSWARLRRTSASLSSRQLPCPGSLAAEVDDVRGGRHRRQAGGELRLARAERRRCKCNGSVSFGGVHRSSSPERGGPCSRATGWSRSRALAAMPRPPSWVAPSRSRSASSRGISWYVAPGAEAGGPTARRVLWFSTGHGSITHNCIADNGVEDDLSGRRSPVAGQARFGGVAGTDQNVGRDDPLRGQPPHDVLRTARRRRCAERDTSRHDPRHARTTVSAPSSASSLPTMPRATRRPSGRPTWMTARRSLPSASTT